MGWLFIAVAVIAVSCAVDYAQRHLEGYVARRHFED